MTEPAILGPHLRRRSRIEVLRGSRTFWPQFPESLPQLRASALYIVCWLEAMDVEIFDGGLVSDAQEGAIARETLGQSDCYSIVGAGRLREDSAWERIRRWIAAAKARAVIGSARPGLLGHLYPGMLDVPRNLSLLPATFGSHVGVLGFDDLRVRTRAAANADIDGKVLLAKALFALHSKVNDEGLRRAAQVSTGLDRLVVDFELDWLAYYHRGLDGELHEPRRRQHVSRRISSDGSWGSNDGGVRTLDDGCAVKNQVARAGGSSCQSKPAILISAWRNEPRPCPSDRLIEGSSTSSLRRP